MAVPRQPQFQLVAVDCPDAVALATFYAQLSGLELGPFEPDERGEVAWVEVMRDGRTIMAFQRIEHFVAPTWPTGPVPQQLHLDFTVEDLDDGEQWAISLGARVADYQPDASFRVFFDPAGHPFCLVRGHEDVEDQ